MNNLKKGMCVLIGLSIVFVFYTLFSTPLLNSHAQSAYPLPFSQTSIASPSKNEMTFLPNYAMGYPAPVSIGNTTQTKTNITTILNFLGNNLTFIPLVSRMSLYNRLDAANYADTWAHARNDYFPNYGTGSNCDDCTNYLSQVLLIGGLPQMLIDGSEKDWWYWCDEYIPILCTNSNTWSATDWMNRHISYYYFQNEKYEYKNSVFELEAGDFFLMDLPESSAHGIPNHARVVVGWGFPDEGDQLDQFNLLTNQHCTDRKRVRWNYNIDDENFPINNDIDVWYVTVTY